MPKLPEPLKWLTKSALEDMCVNCGLCCNASIEVEKGHTILVPELRCKHLMMKAGGESGETCCSVYDDRLEVAKGWCFPLAEAIEKGLFPELCPYVQDVKGYVGAKILTDDAYQEIKPQLRKAMSENTRPQWADVDVWKRFIEGEE